MEEDSILVWLDFDAYAFLNFGIINSIIKLSKVKIIGIVSNKENLNFFEKQKLVKFDKIIYYPDCYLSKKNFDQKNLKRIENEYQLKLWLDIFTERSFYKYWTDFYQFRQEEIFSIVENTFVFFEEILKKYKPKFILMQKAGENISNLLLYRLAKILEINVFMPIEGHFHDMVVMARDLELSEIKFNYQNLQNKKFKNLTDIPHDLERFENLERSINIQLNYVRNKKLNYKLRNFLKIIKFKREPIYKNKGKTKVKLLKYKITTFFETKKREKFLKQNSSKMIDNEKFYYFPLQTEPEARILIDYPFFNNQINLIENIARCLPIDTMLYVKEHPIQKTKLWRSIDEYKKILDLPNVKLVHHSINSQEIIKKSLGVITLGGAVGIEAIKLKKPVIIFGNEYYDVISSVFKTDSFYELIKIFKRISHEKIIPSELEILKLFSAIADESIMIPYFSIINDGIVLSSIQRIQNDSNLTETNFILFYQKFKDSFDKMASEIFSKMELSN